MSNNEIGNSAVYDARELGKGKMFLLGFQHMFAMFGATVLVPLLTGLDVQTTLLMAGLGTILFHIFTKLQVRHFLVHLLHSLVDIQQYQELLVTLE